MNNIIGIYLVAINVIAFVMFGMDKYFAVKNRWRISEKTLLLSAALGGSIGAYAAMQTFRHKTKHLKFTLGVPAILLIQIGVVIWLMK